MGMWIGRNRKARVTYGFDEIALVPGRVTINPNEVDITCRLARKEMEPLVLKIPILASAMDGVVDVHFAIAMSELGGVAVLNLEGVQTRYKNPQEVLEKIVDADKAKITALLQRIYQEPVQEDLIAARIRQIKDSGARCLLQKNVTLCADHYRWRNEQRRGRLQSARLRRRRRDGGQRVCQGARSARLRLSLGHGYSPCQPPSRDTH